MASKSLATALRTGLTKSYPAGTTPVRSSGLWGMVRESFAGAWQQGVTVDPIGSLASFSPIYACVTRIAADIAKLGLLLLEDDADGIPQLAGKASPFWLPLRKPNGYQNATQFIRHWLICKLLFGNTYVRKERDARGMVRRLHLLDPRRVTPMVTPEGDVYYSLGGDDLSRVPGGAIVPASEIIHDRAATLWHPLVGVAPIFACALSGTLGLRIQQSSSKFFANMSRPSGMLTAPSTIDEVTAKRLKEDWEHNYSGANLGRLAVLGDGLNYQAMTIAAEQSQLAQQLGLSAVDCATAYLMPAYKINQGPMPANNNVQASNQQYYSDCLQGHIEDIEACLNDGLELPTQYSVECDLEGLLRMDSLTQMEVLAKGTKGGLIKPNEGRRRLRFSPVEGGDAVYMQQQDTSLSALAKRDAKADPFATAKPPEPVPAPALPAAPSAAPAPAKSAEPDNVDAELLAKELIARFAVLDAEHG